MDTGSAVAACGPAFADIFLEAIADGGVAYGLPRSQALELAAQMVIGTVKLALESGQHPRCAVGCGLFSRDSEKKPFINSSGDFISTVLFDDRSEVLHDRVPLEEMEHITEKACYVQGCTALLDAVGGAIHHIGTVQKYAREEDRPEKTFFIITTDGMENASRQYGYEKNIGGQRGDSLCKNGVQKIGNLSLL